MTLQGRSSRRLWGGPVTPGCDQIVKLEADSENNTLRVEVSMEVPACLTVAEKLKIQEELYMRAVLTMDQVTDMLTEMGMDDD